MEDLLWAQDAVVPGAGNVVKNIVLCTTILLQGKSCRQQRITMTHAVVPRKGSKRKTTVQVDIVVIAVVVGERT